MRILSTYLLVVNAAGYSSRRKSSARLRVVLVCGCLFSFVMLARAQHQEEQAIRQQRQQSNEAIARHDTASLAQYWLDDIHVLTSRSASLQGKSANLRAFQQEFQSKEKLIYVRTPATIEVFSSWNMAAEYGRWTGTWVSSGEAIRVSGSYYAKWHYQNDKWKIKSEIYVPATCEGSEYCKTFPAIRSYVAAIVVQNYYFPKPGKEGEVMETRRRASQVRAQLGLPAGRILQRISESTAQAYVVWECEYPSLHAREEDLTRLDRSEEFKKVQDHMSTLLEKFDRGVWLIRE
ncbi:MAG TPA: nuclear transport factor 2 family protein [Chryseolinea sp.]